MIDRTFGPYRLLEQVGAGGMGVVYRARDTRLGRDVAIKVLPEAFTSDPDRLRRFEQEARAVAALNHPNIVSIHDVGTHEGTPFVVTELLEGETLRQWVQRGPLPLRKAVAQAVEIATGLAAAHERGVVHRDVKPENLLVTTSGRVKILDFGLARRGAAPDGDPGNLTTVTRNTSPGVKLGTVGYMSPEQVRGVPADQRSDVFSLGCVLYEMLSGQRAFARPTSAETLAAILREDPAPFMVSGAPLPRALERTLRRCLEKSPAERFQSARDLAYALEAVSPDSAQAVAIDAPAGDACRSHVRRAAIVACLLIGVLALGYVAGRWGGTSGRPQPIAFERLTFSQGPVVNARFGPDGQAVFYGAAREGRPFRIFQTRREGGELASSRGPRACRLTAGRPCSTSSAALEPGRLEVGPPTYGPWTEARPSSSPTSSPTAGSPLTGDGSSWTTVLACRWCPSEQERHAPGTLGSTPRPTRSPGSGCRTAITLSWPRRCRATR